MMMENKSVNITAPDATARYRVWQPAVSRGEELDSGLTNQRCGLLTGQL